jgi:hypothetical protein
MAPSLPNGPGPVPPADPGGRPEPPRGRPEPLRGRAQKARQAKGIQTGFPAARAVK